MKRKSNIRAQGRQAATQGAARHFQGECVDVLVIGAGPAGLAAALEAKAEGAASVVVLDRLQGYSRCRSIIIDCEVLSLLEEWGVCLDGINQVETFSYVHGYGSAQKVDRIPFPRLNPLGSNNQTRIEPRSNDILFKRLPRAVQRIKDLEEAMLKTARDQGIEVLFDALVSKKPIFDDHSAKLECQINGDDRRFDCEYLVVADGSRSPTSQLLGIRRIPCKMRSYQYTCSVFDSARRDVLLYWVPHHPSGITEMTGLGSGSQFTLVSRLPTEFSEFSADDLRQSRLPKMINQAAASIGIDGKLTEGPMPFSTEMDRLEEVAMHPRVLCVGDAARKGDPGFGGNMNEAVRDGRRFGAYLKVARQDPRNSEYALKHFQKEMQGATSALQTGGALTNNMRAFFSIGESAQALLPKPIRSLLHFDVSLLMKATGTMVGFLNSSSRSTQHKR